MRCEWTLNLRANVNPLPTRSEVEDRVVKGLPSSWNAEVALTGYRRIGSPDYEKAMNHVRRVYPEIDTSPLGGQIRWALQSAFPG
jgi:hypothetical protein